MPAKLNGSVADLIAYIEQKGGRAVKMVNDQLETEAYGVQTAIRNRMPVEHGNLEDSLKVKGYLRKKWSIYVDGSVPDDTGKYTVGDYAAWLNEARYELGPASIAKEGAVGVEVGPKFMERGLQAQLDDGLMERLHDVLNEAVKK